MNRLNYPHLTFQNQRFDLTQLDREDLIALKIRVDAELDKVRGSIAQAKAQVRTSGEFADPKWFHRVQSALHGLGRISQAIQLEMGKRPKKGAIPLSQHFMEAARILLGKDTFEVILEAAHARQDEHKKGERL